jgi:DNA-binding CsgD family transcriptional regulator
MIPKQTDTGEQIISKLREAEVLISQGKTISAVAKQLGISE